MAGEQMGIGRFRARKEAHDQIERDLRKFMDFESDHPELYHYTSTRFYTMDVPGSEDEEYWMFIDRFRDWEDYRMSLYNASHSPDNKAGQELMAKVISQTSEFSADIEHWTEVASLRVDDQGH